jgi:tetratricopeptide (TPR) repeat protein
MKKGIFFILLIAIIFLVTMLTSADARDKVQAKQLLSQGDQKLHNRLYTEAIGDYNRAIELDPEFKEAYNHRGLAKFYLNDFMGAIADYDQAVELDPKFIEAYYNRGLAGYGARNYIGCIPDFDKVIELDEKDADAYFMRGLAKTYVAEISIDSACEDFRKAKELGHKAKVPGQPDADVMIAKYCSGN